MSTPETIYEVITVETSQETPVDAVELVQQSELSVDSQSALAIAGLKFSVKHGSLRPEEAARMYKNWSGEERVSPKRFQ